MSTLKTNNIQHVDRSDPSIIINTDGSVNVAGVLTYEDVTSVDSIGIVTARGLSIFGNTTGLNVTGVSTFGGNVTVPGLTATSFLSVGDDDTINVGNGNDLKIYHQSSDNNSYIENDTGNLTIRADAANKDITLQAADILVFNTGGANERLRITSDGAVGINSTTPTTGYKLDVNGDLSLGESNGTSNTFLDQKQDGDFHIINSGRTSNGASATSAGGVGINRYNNISGGTSLFRDFTVYDGKNTKVLSVDGSAGKVGIGTDSPQEELTIMSATPALMLRDSDQPNSYTQVSNANQDMFFSANGASAHANFIFRSGNNGTFIERLRIDSSGHVQIKGTDKELRFYRDDGARYGVITYDGGQFNIRNPANDNTQVTKSDGTLHTRFENGGNLTLSNGNLVISTSGKGIDFSANTSDAGGVSAELLDDYEEGTWTPSYGSSSVPTSTYATTGGRYTRVGRLVTVTGRIQMTNSTTNTGALTMGGFPFACSNHNFPGGITFTYTDNWYGGSSGDTAQVTFLMVANTQYGYFYNGDGNTIGASSTYDNARRTLHFIGSYETDA